LGFPTWKRTSSATTCGGDDYQIPRKRESAVVSLADKISTLCEVLRISHWMRSNRLSELFSAPEYGFAAAAAAGSADAAS
jgi:hypothetical protein